MLEALILDVDGTIAETEELHRQAFNRAFSEHGLALAWDGARYRELLRVTGGRERIAADFESRGESLDPDRIARIHHRKNTIYGDLVRGGAAALRPGVGRLLSEARGAGVRIAVATTTSRVNLQVLFNSLFGAGWEAGFACLVCGDEVARKKPAPDVYLAVLAHLGVDPRNAVALEDSQAGVRAAHAAGLRVIATPSAFTEGDDFTRASLVVPHLGEPGEPCAAIGAVLPQPWVTLADLDLLTHERTQERTQERTLERADGPLAA
jgi:HAD superfamily hydrolase (TIGR01509 family)